MKIWLKICGTCVCAYLHTLNREICSHLVTWHPKYSFSVFHFQHGDCLLFLLFPLTVVGFLVSFSYHYSQLKAYEDAQWDPLIQHELFTAWPPKGLLLSGADMWDDFSLMKSWRLEGASTQIFPCASDTFNRWGSITTGCKSSQGWDIASV